MVRVWSISSTARYNSSSCRRFHSTPFPGRSALSITRTHAPQHTDAQLAILEHELARGSARMTNLVRAYRRKSRSQRGGFRTNHSSRETADRRREAIATSDNGSATKNSLTAVHNLELDLSDLSHRFSPQTTRQVRSIVDAAQSATRQLNILNVRSRTRRVGYYGLDCAPLTGEKN